MKLFIPSFDSGQAVNALTTIFSCICALTLISGCVDSHEECSSQIESGQFELALTTCETALDHSPTEELLLLTIKAAGSLEDYSRIDQLLKQSNKYPVSADAFYAAGRSARIQRHPKRANNYFDASIEMYRADNRWRGVSNALHQQARLSLGQSQYSRALTLANEAFEAGTSACDSQLEAQALEVLFNVFQATGNYELAVSTLDQIKQRKDPKQKATVVVSAYQRGVVELDRFNYGLAAHEFKLALKAAEGTSYRAGFRGLHLNMVEVSLGLGRMDEAIRHLDKAWSYAEPDGTRRFALHFYQGQIAHEQGDFLKASELFTQVLEDSSVSHGWLWEIHFYAGLAAKALNRHKEALMSFRASVLELENVSRTLAYDSLRGQLLTQQRSVYESLFLSALKMESIDEAIDTIERSKARAFVDAYVSNTNTAKTSSVSTELHANVIRRIESVQSYLAALTASQILEAEPIRDIAAKVQSGIVLVHFSAEGQLWVGKISAGTSSLHRAATDEKELSELLDEYTNDPEDHNVLSRLGDILLPPHLLPEPGKHIFIVPDLLTEHVALAGLRTNGKYFIEQHSFSLIPNINMLAKLPTRNSDEAVLEKPVVLGDPLNNLPSAALEARGVADFLKTNSKVGSSATLDALLGSQRSKVLHVATHSGIDSLGPWLQLADGKIYADNLLQYNLAPELTVLASCVSAAAVGKNVWGSLGAVFMATGSSSVLATLWSVEDQATSVVLENFYISYQKGVTASQALAAAQRASIDLGLPPKAWAPFVILGDRKISRKFDVESM